MTQGPAWPLPPHIQIRDFLPPEELAALLDWTLANREQFRPATIIDRTEGQKSKKDRSIRMALTTRDFEPLRPMLEKRLLEALPEIEQATGTRGGTSLELELAAHPDGAFYRPHVDITVGEDRSPVGAKKGEDRLLSAVFYYYREPKGFSGGELRLFRFNIRPHTAEIAADDYVDVRPIRNSLLAFPSWATHEVRPIACPSNQFEDYRFALNCWFCRAI